MGLVQIVGNAVGLVREPLGEPLVVRLALGYILDEAGYLDVALVLPGVGLPPVAVEVFLYLLHLLRGSRLGILLHTSV